jgi:vacuolar-type H+-ATPase subunit E/Vma4
MDKDGENPIENGDKLERNPDGTIKSGVLNPNGRPKGARSFTTKVREALEKIAEGKDYSYEEALIKSIMKNAIVDGDQATQRLIWNYLDGMPAQDITSGGEKINPCPIYGGLSSDKEV